MLVSKIGNISYGERLLTRPPHPPLQPGLSIFCGRRRKRTAPGMGKECGGLGDESRLPGLAHQPAFFCLFV